MLPDLALPVSLGEDMGYLVARDVPTALFFYGFPAEGDVTWENRGAREDWRDNLLARVTVEPPLTPELVQRIGPERDSALTSYFRAVGWQGQADDRYPPAFPAAPSTNEAGLIQPRPEIPPARFLTAAGALPHGIVLKRLSEVAERVHQPPHALWCGWSISEFLFTLRALDGAGNPYAVSGDVGAEAAFLRW